MSIALMPEGNFLISSIHKIGLMVVADRSPHNIQLTLFTKDLTRISVGPCNGSPLQCFKTYFSTVNPAGNLNLKRRSEAEEKSREIQNLLQHIMLT